MSTASVFKRVRAGLLAILCTTVSASAVWSQSTDFSRPTPLTSVPLIGEHDGSQNISRFYSFEAGPGNMLVTFDGHASRYSTSAQVRLWDANRNAIGDVYLVASTSPSSQTKRFTLPKRQRVVLETVLHEDTSMGVLKYSVNVSGPVQLARETPGAPAAATSSAPSATPARTGSGKVHIEMLDGSTHEFKMSNVRRIIVE